MKPRLKKLPPKVVSGWCDLRESNAISEELAIMSQWLLKATIAHHTLATVDKAGDFASIFTAIFMIHQAEGSIPKHIYQYRYEKMSEFLEFARGVNPQWGSIMESCL